MKKQKRDLHGRPFFSCLLSEIFENSQNDPVLHNISQNISRLKVSKYLLDLWNLYHAICPFN